MTDAPNTMSLASKDLLAERIESLRDLIPEAFVESKIDFEKLRLVLGDAVEEGKERYGLSWAGKAEAMRAVRLPSVGTLVPMREESVDFETTQNLILEGDNLEVLKLLQKSYTGRVKLIYIDPPYNTGNDFVYSDDFADGMGEYLRRTGQLDPEGHGTTTARETSGRLHSQWLSMLHPRLVLARNLLTEDGAIFVSIDEHEVHHLRALMNEVFGEENFVAQIVVVNNFKGRNDRKNFATAHEYLLVFGGRLFEANGLPLSEKQLAEYRERAADGMAFQWRDLRKRGGADTRAARPRLFFPVYVNPSSGTVRLEKDEAHQVEVFPRKSDGSDGCWRWGTAKVSENIADLRGTRVEHSDRWNVSYKVFLEKDGEERVSKAKSVWFGPEFSTDAATKSLRALLPSVTRMTPKPVGLLKQIIQIGMDDGDLCLDFFAGSGTLAQAAMELCAEDGSERRWILVQFPEPMDGGIRSLAHMARLRARYAGDALRQRAPELAATMGDRRGEVDFGFRAYRLSRSNFKLWAPDVAGNVAALASTLENYVEPLVADAQAEAVVWEILMKLGLPLATDVHRISVGGEDGFSVSAGALVICLASPIMSAQIARLLELRPRHVRCLNAGFRGQDTLLANTVLQMKDAGIDFQTV